MIVVAAFVLGIVSGMRTFTGLAAIFLMRGGWQAWLFGIIALGEYGGDLLPQTPSRLQLAPLLARFVAGAACGWIVAGASGAGALVAALAGVAGAAVGAYGGSAFRLAMIARIGPIPAALGEDAVAIGLAAFAVLRLV